jgi:hypothetical protein
MGFLSLFKKAPIRSVSKSDPPPAYTNDYIKKPIDTFDWEGQLNLATACELRGNVDLMKYHLHQIINHQYDGSDSQRICRGNAAYRLSLQYGSESKDAQQKQYNKIACDCKCGLALLSVVDEFLHNPKGDIVEMLDMLLTCAQQYIPIEAYVTKMLPIFDITDLIAPIIVDKISKLMRYFTPSTELKLALFLILVKKYKYYSDFLVKHASNGYVIFSDSTAEILQCESGKHKAGLIVPAILSFFKTHMDHLSSSNSIDYSATKIMAEVYLETLNDPIQYAKLCKRLGDIFDADT